MSHCDDFKKNLWKCSPFAYFVQLQYCDAILWWLYDVRTLKTLTLTQNLKWILPVWKVTVWQKMGKSGVENEKSWMWNVFYVLVAFITCFSILYRKFFTLRSHFKKPTSQCDIPKNAKISHSFVLGLGGGLVCFLWSLVHIENRLLLNFL